MSDHHHNRIDIESSAGQHLAVIVPALNEQRTIADVIVNMDGDGQFRPEDIPDLIAPILTRRYGFVTCTRFGDPEKMPKMPGIKLWGNRMMCRLVNTIIGGQGFTDVSCGFRAYSRDTALRMNLFGSFTYTQETFIDLAAKRVSMTEVPLAVRGEREYGKSRVASNLWHYAFRTSSIILRALRDWRPLLFFGSIAVAFSGIGTAMLAFVGWWWMTFHQTSPWTSLITVGGVFAVMGVAFAVLALIADQIGRIAGYRFGALGYLSLPVGKLPCIHRPRIGLCEASITHAGVFLCRSNHRIETLAPRTADLHSLRRPFVIAGVGSRFDWHQYAV